MKRVYIIILFLGIVLSGHAQNTITHSFKNANLPDVLRYIDSNAKNTHVHFIFDDLDGIPVNKHFERLTALEAVKLAVGAYPIKVTEDEGDIYVEYDKSIIKDVVLSNVTVYGTKEAMSILDYMRNMMQFSLSCPQEKAYLHFDNTGYFMGETIWFKAYITKAVSGERTDLSKVLYVELVNPDGEVLKTQKLYINNGEAQGSFLLEDCYMTGFYEIRAYTRYMLNWGSTGIFSRVMPIFKTPKKEGDYSKMELDKFAHIRRDPAKRQLEELPEGIELKKKYMSDNLFEIKRLPEGSINVHFYPEGGNLVEDLTSRVAFTVTDSEGDYFDCEGVLVDDEGNTIHGAVTLENGRGYFEVTPSDDPIYLRIKTSDKKTQQFQLPEPEQEGTVLTLNTLPDDYVSARLTASLSMSGHMLGYTLMHDGRIITCDTMTCIPSMNIRFERKGLPGGVNQLTVFDSDGRIQAERLFFICPERKASDSIRVTTTNKVLSPCGKVNVDLHTRPNASVSFSAMDIASMTNGKQGNALTWMLLSSDVKGYIDNPDYYFENDDREHRIKADLLMMVQGWRRYDWKLMAGKAEFRKIQPIEDQLYLFGQLEQKKKKNPVDSVQVDVWLYNRLGDWLHGQTYTDSVGNYAFKTPDMSGEWTLLFNTKKDDEAANYKVMIDRNISPMARYLSPAEASPLPAVKPNLFNDVPDSVYDNMISPTIRKRSRVLPEVKVKAKRRIFEGARAAWESETQAQYWAHTYYNIDKEVDKIIDEGKDVPPLLDWLYMTDRNFSGLGTERKMPTKELSNFEEIPNIVEKEGMKEWADNLQESYIWNIDSLKNDKTWTVGHDEKSKEQNVKDKQIKYKEKRQKGKDNKDNNPYLYWQRLDYKGRPIAWVIDNEGIVFTSEKYESLIPGEFIPLWMEDVKAIYISEEPFAYKRYLKHFDNTYNRIEALKPITIFVYTHHTYLRNVKGLRRTHFQAYNDPQTFKMDDYSALPPMEDFRRTIFWEPNVKTDSEGNAHLEFYNNSSCRYMYISAEGMDQTGKFIVNE